MATTIVASMKQWRDTEANWAAANPIIPDGEMIFTRDTLAIRIGDGVKRYNELPVLVDGMFPSADDLTSAVAAAENARAEALIAVDNAVAAADLALDHANAAAASATKSLAYAQAPVTEDLDSGGVSAKVSADNAALSATTTRDARRGGTMNASEVYPQSSLYRKRRCIATGAVVVTIPPNIFTSTDDIEAWGMYRLEGTGGSIQFVPQGGSLDLQPATIKAQNTAFLRSRGVPKTLSLPMAIPAMTNGKFFISLQCGFDIAGQDLTSIVASVNQSLTLSTIKALPSTNPTIYQLVRAVYEVPLVAVAAKTVTLTIPFPTNFNIAIVDWWAVEGTNGGAAVLMDDIAGTAPANTVSATFATSLGNQTLILATAAQVGNLNTISWNGFASTILQAAAGNSSAIDDVTVPDTNGTRNAVSARGSKTLSATAAAFVGTANFNAAAGTPAISMIAVPPVSSPGSGTVVLHLEDGVDTLTKLNGEAELNFAPDGQNVWIKMSR